LELSQNSSWSSEAIQNSYEPVTGGINHLLIRLPKSSPALAGASNKLTRRSDLSDVLASLFVPIMRSVMVQPPLLLHVCKVAPQLRMMHAFSWALTAPARTETRVRMKVKGFIAVMQMKRMPENNSQSKFKARPPHPCSLCSCSHPPRESRRMPYCYC